MNIAKSLLMVTVGSLVLFSGCSQEASESISLYTREMIASVDNTIYDTEMDSVYQYQYKDINLDNTAIVLIDIWAYHPNDGYAERMAVNIENKIVPLLDLARKHNMTIIHAPTSHEISNKASPIDGELVESYPDKLKRYLEQNNISTLIYAGYASNMCLLTKPAGMFNMARLGYNIILLRDCTIAFELPNTLESEFSNYIAISIMELSIGKTSTLDDLQNALERQEV